MSKATLLIIDFNNTVVRSMAVNRQLSWNGIPTGGVYGFVAQFVARINEYSPTHFLVCRDKGPYLRKTLYPDYKGNREKKEETETSKEFYEGLMLNFDFTKRFLELVQLPLWYIKGLEADDLIAIVVNRTVARFEKIIILSNDDDLNQLLVHHNVHFHKRKQLYGYEQFKEEYPTLEPEQWVQASALAGTHNSVPGIKGVGMKTAAKLLGNPTKLAAVLAQHGEMYERNLKLIRLPYPDYPGSIRTPLLTAPAVDERAVLAFLDTFGINYTERMRDAFEQYRISRYRSSNGRWGRDK